MFNKYKLDNPIIEIKSSAYVDVDKHNTLLGLEFLYAPVNL